MAQLNYQYVIAGILLLIAIIYVVRNIVRSLQSKHDCPDCGVAEVHKNKLQPKK